MFVCLFSYPKPRRRYHRQPGGVSGAIYPVMRPQGGVSKAMYPVLVCMPQQIPKTSKGWAVPSSGQVESNCGSHPSPHNVMLLLKTLPLIGPKKKESRCDSFKKALWPRKTDSEWSMDMVLTIRCPAIFRPFHPFSRNQALVWTRS